MLPLVEVSHLPSASSFYSAVTQPLGLQFISTAPPRRILPSSEAQTQSITYGVNASPPTPFFDVAQVSPTAEKPLKHSRLVLSAASPSIVRRFQAVAHEYNEADRRTLSCPAEEPETLHRQEGTPSVVDDWRLPLRATAMDRDGNTMEVVYVPPSQYPEAYSGSTVRKTNSTQGEISRIMTWSYDVAASDTSAREVLSPLGAESSPHLSSHHVGSVYDDHLAPVVRRTITTTTVYEPVKPPSPPTPESSSGSLLATGAVVGLLGLTAAGAALGAGVAYGVMKERSRQVLDAPSFERRSTYPEPYLDSRTPYPDYGSRDRDFASIADRRPPATLVTRYSQSRVPRDAENVYENGRSQHSSRIKPSGSPNVRTRSEASSSRKPLLLTDVDLRSHANSKYSTRTSDLEDVVAAEHRSLANSRHTHSKSVHTAIVPSIRRSNTYDADRDRDQASHTSHGTVSTVRGPPRPTAQTQLSSMVSRPKSISRVSGPTAPRRSESYVSAREIRPPASRSASYVAATRAPLPASGVGGSKAGYEEDICSIAPSDSISCIGSRHGSRVHH